MATQRELERAAKHARSIGANYLASLYERELKRRRRKQN